MISRRSAIRYGDLWALLRKLGFTDELVHDGAHRVWEHKPSGSLFTIGEYPPDEPAHEMILNVVRLELDNFGNLSREEFDRWARRRAKANETATNGTKQTTKPRKPRPQT
jgi:hypothetical protein